MHVDAENDLLLKMAFFWISQGSVETFSGCSGQFCNCKVNTSFFSEFRTTKIIKIGLFFTELFLNKYE